MGRPSIFTPELAAEICRRLEDSEGNLSAVCRADDMPDRGTVIEWASKHEEFSNNYARARQRGYERMAEDILRISDDGVNDYVEKAVRGGGTQVLADTEHINRSRLRVDTRKWLLSKVLPKIYGERIAHEHSGPDGGPVQIDDGTRASRIAAILTAGAQRRDSGEDLV